MFRVLRYWTVVGASEFHTFANIEILNGRARREHIGLLPAACWKWDDTDWLIGRDKFYLKTIHILEESTPPNLNYISNSSVDPFLQARLV